MKGVFSESLFAKLSEKEMLAVTGGCVVNGRVTGYNPHPVIDIPKRDMRIWRSFYGNGKGL